MKKEKITCKEVMKHVCESLGEVSTMKNVLM